jgi:predicted TIM-barrel fold metal-dependent hydrolase
MSGKYSKIEEEALKPEWRAKAKLSYHTVEEYGARGNISEGDVARVLEGGIDIHVHGYPEALVDTGWDFAWEAKRAYDARMRAIVFKSMHSDTAPMAYFVQQILDDYAQEQDEEPRPFGAFGGVVLNWSVGGLNPVAAETSAKLGAKIIWLPSHDTAHHMKVLEEGQGIEVLDAQDRPLPELVRIFEIVAKYNIILDLCHTSTKERFIITEEAQKHGVNKILLTHPQWNVNRMSVDQMAEISRLGAYIGLFLYSAFPHFNNPSCDRSEVLRIIEKVGPERCVMASDFGSMLNPPPVEGLKLYIRLLLAMGISEADIRTMLVANPAKLLGLET